jgi:hypothetical protein
MTLALWALVGVVVIGMLLRMPIGFSMLMAGVAYLLVKGQDLGLVAEQVSNGLYNSYVLLAVPLFVFAANIMNAGTVSERIFDFCRILVGRMRGGTGPSISPARNRCRRYRRPWRQATQGQPSSSGRSSVACRAFLSRTCPAKV